VKNSVVYYVFTCGLKRPKEGLSYVLDSLALQLYYVLTRLNLKK